MQLQSHREVAAAKPSFICDYDMNGEAEDEAAWMTGRGDVAENVGLPAAPVLGRPGVATLVNGCFWMALRMLSRMMFSNGF